MAALGTTIRLFTALNIRRVPQRNKKLSWKLWTYKITDLGFMVSLGDDLKSEELFEDIISMKGGKTPGPDGITIELYKVFHHKLICPFWICTRNP